MFMPFCHRRDMGSSGAVDSGRSSGAGRSNFSQTCSLLSQYLKQKKGSPGGLNMAFSRNQESNNGAPTGTMNLLPMIEKSGSMDETQKKSDQVETSQMTIFYRGQVIVFDDFPADKAKEIMALAGSSTAAAPDPHKVQSSPESTTDIVPAFGLQEPRHSAQPALDTDLPIARRHSLARFLEKRKDRITANAPYLEPSKRAVKTEPWLGLAPHFLSEIQHN